MATTETAPPDADRASWTDDEVDQLLGNLLRVGVIIATIVAVIGGLLFLGQHWADPAGGRVFLSEPAELRSLGGIIRGVTAFRAASM